MSLNTKTFITVPPKEHKLVHSKNEMKVYTKNDIFLICHILNLLSRA